MPYQKYIDNGWFEVTTQTFAGSTGAHQKFTTKITGKGQIALAKKIVEAFRKEEAA
ncbi:phage antirepressor KilAC domain-containing protein [Hydrogenimonas sp.]